MDIEVLLPDLGAFNVETLERRIGLGRFTPIMLASGANV